MLWQNGDAVLRNLLIPAVPGIFIAAKKNPVTGFGNVICLQLLTHLQYTYEKITEKDLEDNVTCMKTQWNPLTAIESLFVQIEDDIAFTAKANNKPAILRWAYDIVAKTGRFEIVCIEWRHFDGTKMTKDGVKFKANFKAADRDMQSQETMGTAGYHGAHNAATNDISTMNAALFTTTQAALTASEIALTRAISQVSLSSSPDTHPRA
jgi:hypothetical protein